MSELKYAKYIISDTENNKPELAYMRTRILCLNDEVVPGAMDITCVWYTKASNGVVKGAHSHDFDEVLAFIGTNPEDMHDLGGEVEIWLGDEKYILTKSCLVFLPKGLVHGPYSINRVDRPIFHFVTTR